MSQTPKVLALKDFTPELWESQEGGKISQQEDGRLILELPTPSARVLFPLPKTFHKKTTHARISGWPLSKPVEMLGFGFKRHKDTVNPAEIAVASAQLLRNAIAPSSWHMSMTGATTLFFEGRSFNGSFLLHTLEIFYEN